MTAPTGATDRTFAAWTWLVWWVPIAVAVGLFLGAFGPDVAELFGYRPLGVVAGAGQPLARILGTGSAVTAVAGLLVAVVFAPGRARGALSITGHDALRVVRTACAVLAVAAFTTAVLTVAENTGLRPTALLTDPAMLAASLGAVEPAAGWAIAALIAALVGASASVVLTWRGATGLLVVMIVGLVVPAATAVANPEQSHDWYGDALTLHALSAVVWLGSTVAVVALWRRGVATAVTHRRHRRIAAVCSVILLLSGLVPVVLDVGPAALVGTVYGQLILVSAALLLVGLLALRQRRPGSVATLLALEAAALTLAAVAGTVMSRLVPPGAPGEADRLTFLLGYGLPPRMGLAELAGWWRFDLLFAPAAALGVLVYLAGVRRLARGGWPRTRTASWLAGCATVLVATSSGIGAYATAVFPAHMLAHALLSTVAPVLLVLGRPLTLVRRATARSFADRVDALLDAAPIRTVNNPAVAWCLTAAALLVVYVTGLFDAIVLEHWAHPAMDAVSLVTGLILFRAILGARLGEQPAFGRLAMLFAVMMLHAGFAIWMLTLDEPLAAPFYTAVAMPFVPDLLGAQQTGAVLAWVVSDLGLLVAALAVVRTWLSGAEVRESAGRSPAPVGRL